MKKLMVMASMMLAAGMVSAQTAIPSTSGTSSRTLGTGSSVEPNTPSSSGSGGSTGDTSAGVKSSKGTDCVRSTAGDKSGQADCPPTSGGSASGKGSGTSGTSPGTNPTSRGSGSMGSGSSGSPSGPGMGGPTTGIGR